MKKAIVTLAIGKRYEAIFEQYCRSFWSQYADKHGFDVIVMTKHLDDSARSHSRSPAWQKCLILSQPNVQKYDQVVWVDSDILINPDSPDLTLEVPLDKIGAVDEYATPTKEDHYNTLKRLYNSWSQDGKEFVNNLTATAFHRNFGLDGEFESAVQTGVMVLSPRYHRELLEYVYHNYEDKGEGSWNYEMRPLSYEIITKHLECWLSPKFNMPWPFFKSFMYPFLNAQPSFIERKLRKLGLDPQAPLLKECVTTAFLNNYFLHFAGGTTSDMKYVENGSASLQPTQNTLQAQSSLSIRNS
jgi:hypothetical protein